MAFENKLRKFTFRGSLLCLSFTAACTSTFLPKNPEYTIHVAGDYRAIGECVYGDLRNTGWQIAQLETAKTVELNQAVDGVPANRLQFIHDGASGTKVVAFYMPSLFGRSGMIAAHKAKVMACAS